MDGAADASLRHPLLGEGIAAHAGLVAIVAGGESISYPDLDAAAGRGAVALGGVHRTRDEARVAVLMRPGIASTATLLGVWRAGGLAVPLAVGHPRAELEYVIRDADARLIVSDGEPGDEMPEIAAALGVGFETFDRLL